MKNINKGRFATVVAGAAVLAVFGGGTAVAGSLITSAQIKDSTIVSADVKDGGLKGADIKNSSLKGEDIADGGIKGADIKNGSLSNLDISVFNVSVKSDGDVAYSSGVIGVDHFTEGAYRVTLPQSVQGCSVVATPASPTGPFAPQANLGVANVQDQPNTFVVAARNMNDSNDPIDVGFHAVVVC